MTELEIKANAEQYALSRITSTDLSTQARDKILIQDAYEKGFNDCRTTAREEYGIQWHDLRKDSKDLPKRMERTENTTFNVSNVVHVHVKNVGTVDAYYNYDDDAWYPFYTFIDYMKDIIAWCEIPKFEMHNNPSKQTLSSKRTYHLCCDCFYTKRETLGIEPDEIYNI